MCFQETSKGKVKATKFKVGKLNEIGKALHAFLNTAAQDIEFGRYQVKGDALVYRAPVTDEIAVNPERIGALVGMIQAGALVLLEPSLEKLQQRANNLQIDALDQRSGGSRWNSPRDMRAKVIVIKQDVIARRIRQPGGETVHVGNSSILGLIGRYVSFGNEQANRQQTEIQQRMAELVPMVPFSVFEQAKLNLDALRIIARGPEESVTRKRDTGKRDKKSGAPVYVTETVHFTGASLYQVEEACFLFDLDRRELKHKVFNPFLVKLPAPVTSIKAAYESLKPEDVKAAEAKGLEVLRQGEWFFIPLPEAEASRLDGIALLNKGALKEIELRAGENRPNYAQGMQVYRGKPIVSNDPSMRTMRSDREALVTESKYYCKGKVRHSGREHADLILKGWYRAVPNTATESFTITGDID